MENPYQIDYKTLIENNNLSILDLKRKQSTLLSNDKDSLSLSNNKEYLTKILFLSNYNDFTNAFKIYKKDALIKSMPLVSESFNIFLEMPLKIISRKMKYKIIPIKWENRREGKAKFDIKELRAKYLFTLIYCFFEKNLLKK